MATHLVNEVDSNFGHRWINSLRLWCVLHDCYRVGIYYANFSLAQSTVAVRTNVQHDRARRMFFGCSCKTITNATITLLYCPRSRNWWRKWIRKTLIFFYNKKQRSKFSCRRFASRSRTSLRRFQLKKLAYFGYQDNPPLPLWPERNYLSSPLKSGEPQQPYFECYCIMNLY